MTVSHKRARQALSDLILQHHDTPDAKKAYHDLVYYISEQAQKETQHIPALLKEKPDAIS